VPKFEHEVHDAVARTTVRYWSRRGVNRDTQEIYQDAYEVSLRASETYDPSLNTTPITYLSSCAIRRCQDRLTRRANIASTRSNGYLKELGLTTTRVRMPTSSGATPFVTNVTWECETHEQLVSFRMNELAETLPTLPRR
jgi:DNA-directed RNA polymerase specialized sigma24 family protein